MSNLPPERQTHTEDRPNHTSAYLVIPSFIADEPDLDDSTILLYGRISALCNRNGFCWASDKYLAELTKCSEREVKRRIKLLEDKSFIRRETKKNGVLWDRKIYLTYNMDSNNVYERTVRSLRREYAVPSKGPSRPNNNLRDNTLRENLSSVPPPKQQPSAEKPEPRTAPPAAAPLEEDFLGRMIKERGFAGSDRVKFKKFTEPEIVHGLKVLDSLKSVNSPIGTLLNILKCPENYPVQAPKKKLSTYEELRLHFKNYELYNQATCYLDSSGIAFERGMNHEQLEINQYWSWDSFEDLCANFGIQFKR